MILKDIADFLEKLDLSMDAKYVESNWLVMKEMQFIMDSEYGWPTEEEKEVMMIVNGTIGDLVEDILLESEGVQEDVDERCDI